MARLSPSRAQLRASRRPSSSTNDAASPTTAPPTVAPSMLMFLPSLSRAPSSCNAPLPSVTPPRPRPHPPLARVRAEHPATGLASSTPFQLRLPAPRGVVALVPEPARPFLDHESPRPPPASSRRA
nr:classical arabinogalactan protein 9-like [Lolium perenne]